MTYKKIEVPADGSQITVNADFSLQVPERPIIPFIEGDGIGVDITPVMRKVVDAAVSRAYGGKRGIAWMEVYAGEKAVRVYGDDCWLPDETLEAIRDYVVSIKGPLTTPVGGGIRSLDDVRKILLSGADKVAVNTAAIRDPSLIDQIARQFGSQCMVLSIEAKRVTGNRWEAYTDNGREKSGRDVISWAREAADRGAGEILLTSVDREGTRRGFDLELVASVTQAVRIPVVASGGMGQMEHLAAVVQGAGASAIAMADILHYGRASLPEIRDAASRIGIPTRKVAA